MIAPMECLVGQTVTFEGYADDYGRHIAAMEFSLDGGASWSTRDTSASDPNHALHWTFAYTPQEPGTYEFLARAVSDDGTRTPVAASTTLFVR